MAFLAPISRRIRRRWRQVTRQQQGPIYLISACGQPNFGDEFITRSWLDWLAKHHPDREVWLDSIEPGRASHLFRDTHPRLQTTNTLWNLAHTGPDDLVESSDRIRTLILELGSPRFDLGLRDLRRMESIHLLGGGFMNSIWPENIGVLTAMTTLREEFGIRILATGQGLLPADGEVQERIRELLARFDYVEARDDESASVYGISNGADDAFLAFANDRPIYAEPDGLPDSMVLVQTDMVEDARNAELDATIAGFVNDPAHRGAGFAEAIPPQDANRALPYIEDGADFFPFVRTWEDGFPARSGQEWLTSRFHFHLLAAAAGAKGAVVHVKPGYYDVKHDSLVAVGTGWSTVVDGEPIVPTVNPDFPEIARRIGRRKAKLASRLYSTRAPR
ncbi:polysaccharide pyruvyl transferase family protein [Microbacterium sp. ZW T5_45]|uniref:polysaccharide pyruvyl transferase family protein n=1 Tax=Microbacterium sp. ZW T5_45 TaxID=3378080 RepID=UPI003851C03C